jgi:uncharacterized damage-inducible protein DinB
MLNLLDALADQIHRGANGDAWHGPSIREAIDGVTAADAAAHPIPGAHSIWELVLHIRETNELVLRRLGGNGAQLTPEEDWAAVPASTEENWRRDVAALFATNERMQRAVRSFDAERLSEPLVKTPTYSAFTQFAGIPQHDLYHAGQIVLLRKALAAP